MKTQVELKDIDYLFTLNNQKKLVVDRRYQRSSNWDVKMQKLFIDSILRGYPIPMIYLHEKDDKFYIVDGQQRLNALFTFLNNQLRLLNPSQNPNFFPTYLLENQCKWSEKRFNELSTNIQDSLKKTQLSVAVISEVEDREVRNIFVRLQKGKPLTDQQIRDTSISGVNDFVLKIGGKNDLANNRNFTIPLEGIEESPNGHEIFNSVLRTNGIDRGQKRQLAAQLLMLYLEMIENNRPVSIKTKNINDFYIKNLDFSIESLEAKDFENVLDDLYEILEPQIKLANYELIHLFLFLKRLRDLGIKDYRKKIINAFNIFRFKINDARTREEGEYWTEFLIRTSTNSNDVNTIRLRHNFFVREMMSFMFSSDDYTSIELEEIFEVDKVVANDITKNHIKAIRLINVIDMGIIKGWINDCVYYIQGVPSSSNAQNNINNRQIARQTQYSKDVVTVNDLVEFINKCISENPNFINEFQRQTTKSKHRNLVHVDINQLYNRSPHLTNQSCQLSNNWWIGTNISNIQSKNFYEIAKDIIGNMSNSV